MSGGRAGGARRDWLCAARHRMGMTQAEAARACGVSRSAYQKYESGERTPRPRVQRRITRAFRLEANGFSDRLSAGLPVPWVFGAERGV